MTKRTKCLIFCVLVSISFFDRVAQAQTEGVHSDLNSLSQEKELIQREAHAVSSWWWGWLAGYSAATVAQSAVAISTDRLTLRQDMILGAVTTLIGAAGQIAAPVKPSLFHDCKYPGYEIKKMQVSIAEAETKGRSWQMHAASGAVNLGSGLVTWLAFDRTWKDGLLNFALNTAITEAQIWSQPVKVRKYVSDRRASMVGIKNLSGGSRSIRVAAGPAPLGMRVTVVF